jgi:hypothetical protein
MFLKCALILSTQAPDVKQARMFVELCLKKNGQAFYTGRIRFRSRVGLLVQASPSSNPMRLILNAPEYPVSDPTVMLDAFHFQLLCLNP